jgi:HPr kinase/phosphorylase
MSLKELTNEINLDIAWGNDYLSREVNRVMTSRPAVELYADYFNYYESERIQIIGSKEMAIFNMLNPEDKVTRVDKLFSFNPPAFIFFRSNDAPAEFVAAAIKYKIPILKSSLSTSSLISNLTAILTEGLAERQSVHGVMLDVYGVGVLLTGKSGIGKSETALELIKRGHLLISDDRVDIYQREPGLVVGEAPKVTEKLMEIRGIGIVNVVDLFGVGSFRSNKRIMLVVDLVRWEDVKTNDRIGLRNETIKYFDTEIPKITVPVQPGRNMTTLVEVAALNSRLKYMGVNAAEEFARRIAQLVDGGKE